MTLTFKTSYIKIKSIFLKIIAFNAFLIFLIQYNSVLISYLMSLTNKYRYETKLLLRKEKDE